MHTNTFAPTAGNSARVRTVELLWGVNFLPRGMQWESSHNERGSLPGHSVQEASAEALCRQSRVLRCSQHLQEPKATVPWSRSQSVFRFHKTRLQHKQRSVRVRACMCEYSKATLNLLLRGRKSKLINLRLRFSHQEDVLREKVVIETSQSQEIQGKSDGKMPQQRMNPNSCTHSLTQHFQDAYLLRARHSSPHQRCSSEREDLRCTASRSRTHPSVHT